VRSRSRSPSSGHSSLTSTNDNHHNGTATNNNNNGTPSKGDLSSSGSGNNEHGNGEPLSPSVGNLLDFTTVGIGAKEARSPTPSMKKQVRHDDENSFSFFCFESSSDIFLIILFLHILY